MSAFTLDLSNPYPQGGGPNHYGGPGHGGHSSSHWYIQYGMDLGAPGGTPVHAVFDGHITRLNRENENQSSGKVYGVEIFMRSHNDRMGAFFTHLNEVPGHLAPGARVQRGDYLGKVIATSTPHLHLALVEIVNGNYIGVNLYTAFQATINSSEPFTVTFFQDGVTPPAIAGDFGEFGALMSTLDLQMALIALGYDPGAPDGKMGPKTEAAVRAFQGDHSLGDNGIFDSETRTALIEALVSEGLIPR